MLTPQYNRHSCFLGIIFLHDEIPAPQGQSEIQQLQNSAQCASQLIQQIDGHLEDIADAVKEAQLATQAS